MNWLTRLIGSPLPSKALAHQRIGKAEQLRDQPGALHQEAREDE